MLYNRPWPVIFLKKRISCAQFLKAKTETSDFRRSFRSMVGAASMDLSVRYMKESIKRHSSVFILS